jgi:hypothetical protein
MTKVVCWLICDQSTRRTTSGNISTRATRLGVFSTIERLLILGRFVKIHNSPHFLSSFNRGKRYVSVSEKYWLGYILGDSSTNSSGHPEFSTQKIALNLLPELGPNFRLESEPLKWPTCQVPKMFNVKLRDKGKLRPFFKKRVSEFHIRNYVCIKARSFLVAKIVSLSLERPSFYI